MINVRQGVFHLRNEEASYLFRVKDGFLEHLHFGARAETSDALAFAARPGCGWGDSTLYRTKNGRWFLTDASGVQPALYPVTTERAAVYVGMYAAERYGEFFPITEIEEA